MVIDKEKQAELLEAAKPLMKFLADNFHPHVSVTVDSTDAELVEGVCRVKTDEFVKG